MNFLQKISAVWQNVSVVQRALLITITLTFAIVCGLVIHWARRPDMRLLYSNLDPEEAANITENISEKDIVYKLANGGTTIYAPRENIAQLRLDMAKEGLPKGGQKGYGIFDNEKIGISPFVQNINLKRALQDELAKSIQMIDGVSCARVHIVSAKQTLFRSEGSQTSASVVLRLKPGYKLGVSSIAAITHLVAGSIEGLKSENVIVVDSQGRLLSGVSDQVAAGGAGTVADYKQRTEQNLSSKVEDMLTAVLGPGRASVRVSAVIDMNSINIITETYEPKGVASREEIQKGSETKPSSVSSAGKPTVPGGEKTEQTIKTEYEIGKTVRKQVILPGKITSLSVAAFVDLSVADVNETDAGSSGQTEKIMKSTDVEDIIKNALGLDIEGADSLKVVEVKFHRLVKPLISEEEGGLDFVAIAGQASVGIAAICALVVLKTFSSAKKKSAVTTATAELPAALGTTAGLLPVGAETSEPSALRKQIANSLQNDPQQAKQLFLSWLEEKGS